jgi:AcrR family transcriptional regulator
LATCKKKNVDGSRELPGRGMTGPKATTTRPYLRADERREQLLAAAEELVGKRGWGALGIVPLATAAGVSRQLVYEHFADTTDLLASVMRHLFERARSATAHILSAAPDDDDGSVIRSAYDVYLTLPRAQRRALRALAGDSQPDSPEVERARQVMRHEILGMWVPYVRRRTGFAEQKARALAWMFTTAAWAITDLVEDGTLSADTAKALLADVVAGAVVSTQRKRGRGSAAAGQRRERRSRRRP